MPIGFAQVEIAQQYVYMGRASFRATQEVDGNQSNGGYLSSL